MTAARVIAAVVVLWLVLGLVTLIVFNARDDRPGDGRGDRIEQAP